MTADFVVQGTLIIWYCSVGTLIPTMYINFGGSAVHCLGDFNGIY